MTSPADTPQAELIDGYRESGSYPPGTYFAKGDLDGLVFIPSSGDVPCSLTFTGSADRTKFHRLEDGRVIWGVYPHGQFIVLNGRGEGSSNNDGENDGTNALSVLEQLQKMETERQQKEMEAGVVLNNDGIDSENRTELPMNSTVVIHGLQNQTVLNGHTGEVKSGLKDGRHEVWVAAFKKSVRIRPANLLHDVDDFPKDRLFLPRHLGQMFYFTNSEKERKMMATITSTDLCYLNPAVRISTDSNDVAHGRGLINASNKTIEAGDLLFVTPSTVAVDIEEVLRVYKSGSGGGGSGGSGKNEDGDHRSRLEQIAETILLKQMKRHVKRHLEGGDAVKTDIKIASSFLALTCGKDDDERQYVLRVNSPQASELLHLVLLGQHGGDWKPAVVDANEKLMDDDYLLSIIRHNAFGPDFHNYDRMEREINAGNVSCYRRILSHYPLAAMINHSCTTNAQRLYADFKGQEVMVASASKPIKSGEEILWSYIAPALEYNERRELLQAYGFDCQCQRCQSERNVPPLDEMLSFQNLNQPQLQNDCLSRTAAEWHYIIQTLDTTLKNFDNPTARSLRLGWTHLYLHYFNTALQEEGHEQEVLSQAMKLHFSFAEVHNACTEHLSILHLCYDLVARDESQQQKRRMFTEAMKLAHYCRYSALAFVFDQDGVDRLRTFFMHTNLILRNKNGWDSAAVTINEQAKQSNGGAVTKRLRMKSAVV